MGWNSWDIGWHWWNIRRKVLWIWVSTYLWPGRIVVFCLEAMIFVVWWWIYSRGHLSFVSSTETIQVFGCKAWTVSSSPRLVTKSAWLPFYVASILGHFFIVESGKLSSAQTYRTSNTLQEDIAVPCCLKKKGKKKVHKFSDNRQKRILSDFEASQQESQFKKKKKNPPNIFHSTIWNSLPVGRWQASCQKNKCIFFK